MYNENEKKEDKKNSCVVINVFTKCDKDEDEDKKEWEKSDWEKKDSKNSCVEINVFTKCEKDEEKKDHDKKGKCC